MDANAAIAAAVAMLVRMRDEIDATVRELEKLANRPGPPKPGDLDPTKPTTDPMRGYRSGYQGTGGLSRSASLTASAHA